MESLQDTIAAIATPLGEAGLGIIRLSGPAALSITNQIFRSKKINDLHQVPTHTCHFGEITATKPSPLAPPPQQGEGNQQTPPLLVEGEGAGDAAADAGGEGLIDQAVVTIFRSPHSYTGEDVVEISAHGSPFILQEILNLCLRQGARLAGPGEFTQRAFLNGKLDLTQAEAVADLIRSKTDQTHAAALAQLQGRLATEIRSLRDLLLPLLAHIEVGLDHSDEGHEFLNRDQLTEQCAQVQGRIDRILAAAQRGKILREGLRVVLVGRPNVGKSSLLNALLREERAIVAPIAGTTRDTVEESVNWDGIPVVLTDTAGLRSASSDPVEHLGMERTRQAVAQADLVIGLFDGSAPATPEDRQVIEACSHKPHIWAINKIDLPSRWDSGVFSQSDKQAPVAPVSAKVGTGLDRLRQWVKTLALEGSSGAGLAQWLLNARHRAALERTQEALRRALEAAQSDAFEECVALEIQSALQALGEIIGETATEDLLEEIFKHFCVGK